MDNVVRPREDVCTGLVGTQTLQLPPTTGTWCPDGNAAAPRFVQFSPSDVILARQDVTGLSVRNHLRGKVCRIVPTRQAYFVAVDIGQILWAEVTSQAAAELGLQPGAEVVCLVKANSLAAVE